MVDILPTDYLTLLRNFAATVKCAPIPHIIIIEWGWDKDSQDTIGDYMENNDMFILVSPKIRVIEEFKAKYNFFLQKIDLRGCDVTFLDVLLPLICKSKVSRNNLPDYHARINDPTTVEYLLKEIKAMRNSVSHEEGRAREPGYFENLRRLLKECIEAGGKLYGKHQSDIYDAVRQIDDKFHEIIEDTTTSAEKRKKLVRKMIIEKTANKLEEMSDDFIQFSPLPGCHTSNIDLRTHFYSINLQRLKLENGVFVVKENILCNEILKKRLTTKFIVIDGAFGTGKTVLMKKLFHNHLQEFQHNDGADENCKLPVFIDCRTQNATNLKELLISLIPETLKRFKEEDVLNGIDILDNVIFLIEGYDEKTTESEELIHEILKFCQDKENSFVALSGGRRSLHQIEIYLNDLAHDYDHFSIAPLNKIDDKIYFLKTYSKLHPDRTEEMTRTFLSMSERSQDMFSSVLLLTFFYFMFCENTYFEEKSFKSDMDVIEATINYIRNKIEEKISINQTTYTHRIFLCIHKYCLRVFKEKTTVHSQQDFAHLVEKCLDTCHNKLERPEVERVLDCFLTPEFSMVEGETTCHFMNSIFAQYFAARGFFENLLNEINDQTNLSVTINEWIQQNLGFNKIDHQTRYENILLYVLIMMQREERMDEYGKHIVNFIRCNLKTDQKFWFYLVSAGNHDDEVVKFTADAMESQNGDNNWWMIEDLSQVKIVSKLMFYKKVDLVYIKLKDTLIEDTREDLIDLVESIKRHHEGDIKLLFTGAHDSYVPMDNILIGLRGSQCRLIQVETCVATDQALSVLKELAECCEFRISFPDFALPDLRILDGLSAGNKLSFSIKYTDDIPSDKVPIPPSTAGVASSLTITDIPSNGSGNTADLVSSLSPTDKLFHRLRLRRCSLADLEVRALSRSLYDRGYRTNNTPGSGVLVNSDALDLLSGKG